MKLLITLLLSFSILNPASELVNKHWKGFQSKEWALQIDDKSEVVASELGAKSSIVLNFRKEKVLVQYAVFAKNDYPKLREKYQNAGGCLTDMLSGEHGQIVSFFEFKNHYYLKLGNFCGNCLDENDEIVNCRDLDALIVKYRSR